MLCFHIDMLQFPGLKIVPPGIDNPVQVFFMCTLKFTWLSGLLPELSGNSVTGLIPQSRATLNNRNKTVSRLL